MSEENVAIVKSSWAGWRQGLHDQWVRDFHDGVMERMAEWYESEGQPDIQADEFIDGGSTVLVQARVGGHDDPLWFRYTLEGPRIAGWAVHETESEAREAAGL
jgi:hypothetical protein